MKKRTSVLVIAIIISSASLLIPLKSFAGEYQEGLLSIFQRLNDMMTGKYEVEKGKTVKEVNVVQAAANELNKVETAPVR